MLVPFSCNHSEHDFSCVKLGLVTHWSEKEHVPWTAVGLSVRTHKQGFLKVFIWWFGKGSEFSITSVLITGRTEQSKLAKKYQESVFMRKRGCLGIFHYLYNFLWVDSGIIAPFIVYHRSDTVLSNVCELVHAQPKTVPWEWVLSHFTLRLIWVNHEYWTSSHSHHCNTYEYWISSVHSSMYTHLGSTNPDLTT